MGQGAQGWSQELRAEGESRCLRWFCPSALLLALECIPQRLKVDSACPKWDSQELRCQLLGHCPDASASPKWAQLHQLPQSLSFRARTLPLGKNPPLGPGPSSLSPRTPKAQNVHPRTAASYLVAGGGRQHSWRAGHRRWPHTPVGWDTCGSGAASL